MKHFFKLIIFSLCCLSTPLHASEDIERTNLAKIISEVDFLLQRVEKIKHEAAHNQRIRFHYDDLKNDLKVIRSGVSAYINADINNGRVINPLNGNYH